MTPPPITAFIVFKNIFRLIFLSMLTVLYTVNGNQKVIFKAMCNLLQFFYGYYGMVALYVLGRVRGTSSKAV